MADELVGGALLNLETMADELVGGALLSGFIGVFFERLAPQNVIWKFFRGKAEAVKLLEDLNIKLLSAGVLLDDAEEKQLTKQMVNEALAGKIFLFVRDDVWNENYRDNAQRRRDSLKSAFQSGAHGSRLIVTTRSKDVALILNNVAIHELKPVSVDDCWQIFAKHSDDNQAPTELKTIGLETVERCKGLPLAVKSVAGLLRSTSNPKEWREILNSDTWQLQLQENLKNDIVPALWLSYHFLPPVLKRCSAYCSIFPKDYELEQSDMAKIILLWMAEGILTPENRKRMEDAGKAYLQARISRSFFQHSSTNESAMVMHDLVHYLAMFIPGEFCFSRGDSNDLSNLGTLLAFPRSYGGCSLSQSSITEFPDSIGIMKYLRYLDLSWTSIKDLPDSICTLYNLQTLFLSNCQDLQRLPTKLAALVNLHHLDIRGTSLKKMPPQMCKMKSLQLLSDFVLAENGGWRIKELGEFPLLRGSLRISGLEHIVDVKDVLEANLKDKKFLSELILEWRGDSNITSTQQERVLESLQPHTNLKQLRISGYGGTIFPDWMGHESFCNMVAVELLCCTNVRMLPPLGRLSSLRRLEIRNLKGVVSIGNEFCGSSSTTTNHPFTSLQELLINQMDSWEAWSFSSEQLSQEGGVFPSLKSLKINSCHKLIVGLHCHLPSLKSISVWDCDEMVGVFVCQSRQEMDTNAFPSLESMSVGNCPRLEWLLGRQSLPSKSLVLQRCKKLWENRMNLGLQRLPCHLRLSHWNRRGGDFVFFK